MSYLTFKRGRGRPKKVAESLSPLPKRYHPLDFLKKKRLITPEMREAALLFERDFSFYRQAYPNQGFSRISSFVKRESGQGAGPTLPEHPREAERIRDYKRICTLLEREEKGLVQAILNLFETNPFPEGEGHLFLKTISLSKIRKALKLLWDLYREKPPHTLRECHSASLLKGEEDRPPLFRTRINVN